MVLRADPASAEPGETMARNCASIYRAVEVAIEGVFRACDPPHTLAAAIRFVRVLVPRTPLPLGAPALRTPDRIRGTC